MFFLGFFFFSTVGLATPHVHSSALLSLRLLLVSFLSFFFFFFFFVLASLLSVLIEALRLLLSPPSISMERSSSAAPFYRCNYL